MHSVVKKMQILLHFSSIVAHSDSLYSDFYWRSTALCTQTWTRTYITAHHLLTRNRGPWRLAAWASVSCWPGCGGWCRRRKAVVDTVLRLPELVSSCRSQAAPHGTASTECHRERLSEARPRAYRTRTPQRYWQVVCLATILTCKTDNETKAEITVYASSVYSPDRLKFPQPSKFRQMNNCRIWLQGTLPSLLRHRNTLKAV